MWPQRNSREFPPPKTWPQRNIREFLPSSHSVPCSSHAEILWMGKFKHLTLTLSPHSWGRRGNAAPCCILHEFCLIYNGKEVLCSLFGSLRNFCWFLSLGCLNMRWMLKDHIYLNLLSSFISTPKFTLDTMWGPDQTIWADPSGEVSPAPLASACFILSICVFRKRNQILPTIIIVSQTQGAFPLYIWFLSKEKQRVFIILEMKV